MKRSRLASCAAVLAIASAGAIWGSNMGFLVNSTLLAPAVGISKSGTNTLNLPMQVSPGLTDALALINDIGFASVANVQRFVEVTDGLQVYTGRKGSPSPSFPLAAGECYFVRMIANTDYVIEGSHVPGLVIALDAPAVGVSRSGTNFVAVPYHSTAATALDLMTEIGFASVANIQRFVRVNDGLQVFTGRKGSPAPNFPIDPRECYFIRMVAPVAWLPSHY